MRIRQNRSALDIDAELPRLRRFARLLTRNDAEADDLVQETFLRALRSIDGFKGGSALGTWLVQILINLHRSERRKAARRRYLMEGQPPPADSEPARQEQKIELAETLAALDALPEEQREAIALVGVGDMSYADAAEALGVKLGTLMSRISRGRAAMRARLDGSHDEGRKTWNTQAGKV